MVSLMPFLQRVPAAFRSADALMLGIKRGEGTHALFGGPADAGPSVSIVSLRMPGWGAGALDRPGESRVGSHPETREAHPDDGRRNRSGRDGESRRRRAR